MVKSMKERKHRMSVTLDAESIDKAAENGLNLSEILQAAIDGEVSKEFAVYGNVDKKGADLIHILGKPMGFLRCTGLIFYDDSNCQETGCNGKYYPYWSEKEADMHANHWHSYAYWVEKGVEEFKKNRESVV